MEGRSSFFTNLGSSLKKVFHLGNSVTPSASEDKAEHVEECLPDFSNDPVIEGFKQFHAIPIVKFVQDYLQGKIDDELFFIRIRYLNKQDAAILSKWVKEEFAKENPETSARHLLFMGMAYYYGLGFYSDKKAKEYLLAIEKGSTLAISFYADTLVEKLSSKIEYLETAIKQGDNLAYSFLCDLYNGIPAAENYINKGVNKGSVYAQYNYALMILNVPGSLLGYLQAIDYLKTAAMSGLPSALIPLAKHLIANSDKQRAAYYYHYAFQFKHNTYRKEIANRSGDRKIINDPLDLVLGSTDLFTHYCLAGGIGHITDTEVHKNFANKFKELVDKNPRALEKLLLGDEIKGAQQVFPWLDEQSEQRLAIKLNFLHYFLNHYLLEYLPAEIILAITEAAFGKNFKALLDSDLFSLEKKQEKQAQIILHEFKLKEKALLPESFSIFSLKSKNQKNEETEGTPYKVSKLQESIPEADCGEISYSQVLTKSRK